MVDTNGSLFGVNAGNRLVRPCSKGAWRLTDTLIRMRLFVGNHLELPFIGSSLEVKVGCQFVSAKSPGYTAHLFANQVKHSSTRYHHLLCTCETKKLRAS